MSKTSLPFKKFARLAVTGLMAIVATAGAMTIGGTAAHADSTQYSALENAGSWLQLHVPGASTSAGTGLIQWYPNFGDNQQFLYPTGYLETSVIRNKNSNMCLTTDAIAGHQLFQEPCGGAWAKYQWWTVYAYTPWFDFTNVYGIFKNPYSGLVMDVDGASHAAGARVIGWYPNNGLNQSWIMP
jgi:hypothetical protein